MLMNQASVGGRYREDDDDDGGGKQSPILKRKQRKHTIAAYVRGDVEATGKDINTSKIIQMAFEFNGSVFDRECLLRVLVLFVLSPHTHYLLFLLP